MPYRDVPFDPADFTEPDAQLGLLNDALCSGDVAFVTAALKTILAARGREETIGLDPRLSDMLKLLDGLGIDLAAGWRTIGR